MPAKKRTRLSAARDVYLKRSQLTLSRTSVLRNKLTINMLIRSCGDIYVDSLRQGDIERFLAEQSEPHLDVMGRPRVGIGGRSHNVYVCNLRIFVRWMMGRGLIDRDITMGLRRARESRQIKARLERAQVVALLEAAATPRDRALVAICYFTAARASEMRSMRVGDVDQANDTIFIHVWKSKLEDVLPITPELQEELDMWLHEYRRSTLKSFGRTLLPNDFLIPANFPARYAPGFEVVDGRRQQVRRSGGLDPLVPVPQPHLIIKRGLRDIGVPDMYEGVHTLRRSAARHIFDSLVEQRRYDGAIRIVQSLLHHANVQTTEAYLGLSTERIVRDEFLRTAILLGPRASPALRVGAQTDDSNHSLDTAPKFA